MPGAVEAGLLCYVSGYFALPAAQTAPPDEQDSV